ncbi:hypothetical protein GCM10011578_099850 [Streptomyces fuscichromogenes]|uniref:Uncharacterized protein n=1 Tax=Streptomyces fuscichromogenes TaxID=1324013 RepID=A0A917XQT7_9ACTN|nr:hypothetical protein GCM10011578_099850 [Streptomyces fuscichromogenes]
MIWASASVIASAGLMPNVLFRTPAVSRGGERVGGAGQEPVQVDRAGDGAGCGGGVGIHDDEEAHLCDVGDAVHAELLHLGEEDRQAVREAGVRFELGLGVLRRAAADGHTRPSWSLWRWVRHGRW